MESTEDKSLSQTRLESNFLIGKVVIINQFINENIKVVKLEILKVKTWFWNKDLSSLDSIN